MTRGVRSGSFVSAVLLVPLVFALHCGGRTWDPAIAEADFPAMAAAALCGGEGIDSCCRAAGLRGANADCIPVAALQFTKDAERAAAAGERYNGRAAEACVDAWRGFFASCPSPEDRLFPEACARVYMGGRTRQGSSCTSAFECAAASDGTAACLSLQTTGLDRSACGVIVTGGLGDSCNVEATRHVNCAPGLHCDPNSSVCAKPLALGDPCSNGSSDECGVGVVCDPDGQRTCVTPRSPLGGPCSSGRDCDGYACFSGRCGAFMLDLTRCQE